MNRNWTLCSCPDHKRSAGIFSTQIKLQVRTHILSRGAVKTRWCVFAAANQSWSLNHVTNERKNWGGKSSKLCWQTGLKAMCGAQTRCISNANEALHPSADPRDDRDPLKYETN